MYTITAIVLSLKMAAISIAQGRARVAAGVFVNPEDAKSFAGKESSTEAPAVERASRAWRNDLENIPIFLLLGLIYVTLGCSPEGAYIYFTVFIVARILHTVAYLNAWQPWRTIFFTVGMVVCVALSIQILMTVL